MTQLIDSKIYKETRMHSSRMRTARCNGGLGGGGGAGQGVSAYGGVCLGGCLSRGGAYLGVCTPPVDRQMLVKTLPFRNCFCCGR